MVGVYGPQSAARRVIQGVTNMHARVSGDTPKGEAYKALDPELLDEKAQRRADRTGRRAGAVVDGTR